MAGSAPIFVVQEALFLNKLSKVDVPGNSNCLFYSLLTVAGRPLEDHMSLRVLCGEFFARQWLECPPGSGRRSSTYAARLNDCYSGEPAFRGVSPCFPDADAYVTYITRDQAWAGMSEIEVLICLWGHPIIVWSSAGLPTPGLIGFIADVSPINIVYSNRNHDDALIGLDNDASLIAATTALSLKGRTSNSSARANVVNLAGACLPKSPVIDVTRPSTEPPLVVCKSGAPKRKADAQSISPAKKGSRLVDGVRKVHHKWRVGIRIDTLGLKQPRITVPFDYLTEDIANKVYYFIRRSMAGMEPDPKVCNLNHDIIEPLREFLHELRSDTVDAYLRKTKSNALSVKQLNAIPKSNLRGILYDASSGVWCVRVKLRDVFGKEKSTKLPFLCLLEKDASLAYDFTVKHFCSIINQKMNHKLNFPAETFPIERQGDLKCYVEEVLTNSFSFQVGKTLPAVPILRGVDQGSGAFWTIRLSVSGPADAFSVFLSTTRFGNALEASFAYDYLMPKLRKLENSPSALSFRPNFCDYQPFAGFEAQLDAYFEAHLRLHPVVRSLAAQFVPDVPSTNDPIPLKRLRGVLQRGSGFIVRIHCAQFRLPSHCTSSAAGVLDGHGSCAGLRLHYSVAVTI
jgi:hypothetical protein